MRQGMAVETAIGSKPGLNSRWFVLTDAHRQYSQDVLEARALFVNESCCCKAPRRSNLSLAAHQWPSFPSSPLSTSWPPSGHFSTRLRPNRHQLPAVRSPFSAVPPVDPASQFRPRRWLSSTPPCYQPAAPGAHYRHCREQLMKRFPLLQVRPKPMPPAPPIPSCPHLGSANAA